MCDPGKPSIGIKIPQLYARIQRSVAFAYRQLTATVIWRGVYFPGTDCGNHEFCELFRRDDRSRFRSGTRGQWNTYHRQDIDYRGLLRFDKDSPRRCCSSKVVQVSFDPVNTNTSTRTHPHPLLHDAVCARTLPVWITNNDRINASILNETIAPILPAEIRGTDDQHRRRGKESNFASENQTVEGGRRSGVRGRGVRSVFLILTRRRDHLVPCSSFTAFPRI